MNKLLILTALLSSTSAFAADYSGYQNRPYVLSDEERRMAATYAAAATASEVCRETDGAYINRSYFSSWSAQYAVKDAGRERAFKAAIRQARAGIATQVAQKGADDWCDDYLDVVADTYTPMNTPVYWTGDPLGYFIGPPSRSAADVWSAFDVD